MIGVNETEEKIGQVTLTLTGASASRATVQFENRVVPVRGGKLTDRFGPGERHAYILRR